MAEHADAEGFVVLRDLLRAGHELSDSWTMRVKDALPLIEKALASRPTLSPQDDARLGDETAIFEIRIEPGPVTKMHTRAGRKVDPSSALDAAIAVLKAERGDLESCPVHAALKLDEGVIAEVKELRELLAKATQGPFSWNSDYRQLVGAGGLVTIFRDVNWWNAKEGDHELIVAALNALPRLLNLIEGGGK